MCDPLSVTTGVISLISVCFAVGVQIKGLRDGAALADTAVKSLLVDVEGMTHVLQLMKDTMEDPAVQESLAATGTISNHWKNIERSIGDGARTLEALQVTIGKIDKTVDVFDNVRKHLRLKWASDEITMFQHEVRSYTDTLQLSLQTVILWNQVTHQAATREIMPSLDKLQRSVRDIATALNSSIVEKEDAPETAASPEETQNEKERLKTLNNLRDCVQSAATIITSASTVVGDADDTVSDSGYASSDFGDLFPADTSKNDAMHKWIQSNTVSEQDDVLEGETLTYGIPSNLTETHDVDSEDDLDADLVQALFQKANEKFLTNDVAEAERLFRSCLARMPETSGNTTLREQVSEHLIRIYLEQRNWEAAEGLLRIQVCSPKATAESQAQSFSAALRLADILCLKGDYAEARLYGRKALKGYRKLGAGEEGGVVESLNVLIRICHASGDTEEEEAYTQMLSILEGKKPSGYQWPTTISLLKELKESGRGSNQPGGAAAKKWMAAASVSSSSNLSYSQSSSAPTLLRQATALTEFAWPWPEPPHLDPPFWQRTIVVVGAVGTGSSLVRTYQRDGLGRLSNWKAGIRCSFQIVEVDKRPGRLAIIDASDGPADSLQALAIAQADALIMCFVRRDERSLAPCKTKWMPIARKVCPKADVTLVGIRPPNREEDFMGLLEHHKAVRRAKGLRVARDVGAKRYIGVSTDDEKSVDAVFHEAARDALSTRPLTKEEKELPKEPSKNGFVRFFTGRPKPAKEGEEAPKSPEAAR